MKIYIGKSSLHGKGLIASSNIKKGETIFTIKGKKIKFLINTREQAKIAGLNWIGYDKNIWIDPIDYGLYFNHSCNPNAAIKGRVKVIALKNIKKDEEVTFDYSLSEADIFWSIRCTCGSKNCRKVIKSIQFLPSKLFDKYKLYIPRYFKQVFIKFNADRFKDLKDLKENWIDFIKKGFGI